MNYWVMAQYTGMYAAIVLLSILGLLLYIIVDWAERLCVHPHIE